MAFITSRALQYQPASRADGLRATGVRQVIVLSWLPFDRPSERATVAGARHGRSEAPGAGAEKQSVCTGEPIACRRRRRLGLSGRAAPRRHRQLGLRSPSITTWIHPPSCVVHLIDRTSISHRLSSQCSFPKHTLSCLVISSYRPTSWLGLYAIVTSVTA